MLRVDGCSVSVDKRKILRNVDLALPVGVTALVGPNGAGKSTLLNVLATSRRPDEGGFSWRGVDPWASGENLTRYRSGLGWCPQKPAFPPRMRVNELLGYCAWLKLIPKERVDTAVSSVSATTDIGGLVRQRVGTLSGGEERRVALAIGLLGEPDVLLLDESTVGLDPDQRDSLYSIIRTVAEGRVVLLATHLYEDVLAVAEHIVVLENGQATGSVSMSETAGPNGDHSLDSLKESIAVLRNAGNRHTELPTER